jgi:hypothetical protein
LRNKCSDCQAEWESSFYGPYSCNVCGGANYVGMVEIKLETKIIPDLDKWYEKVIKFIIPKSNTWSESE